MNERMGQPIWPTNILWLDVWSSSLIVISLLKQLHLSFRFRRVHIIKKTYKVNEERKWPFCVTSERRQTLWWQICFATLGKQSIVLSFCDSQINRHCIFHSFMSTSKSIITFKIQQKFNINLTEPLRIFLFVLYGSK